MIPRCPQSGKFKDAYRMAENNRQLGERSADAYRLKAVSVQSVPTRDFTSDIRPASSHDTDRLRHSPMGLMALMCPFELSNIAFTFPLAILLRIQVS